MFYLHDKKLFCKIFIQAKSETPKLKWLHADPSILVKNSRAVTSHLWSQRQAAAPCSCNRSRTHSRLRPVEIHLSPKSMVLKKKGPQPMGIWTRNLLLWKGSANHTGLF